MPVGGSQRGERGSKMRGELLAAVEDPKNDDGGQCEVQEARGRRQTVQTTRDWGHCHLSVHFPWLQVVIGPTTRRLWLWARAVKL